MANTHDLLVHVGKYTQSSLAFLEFHEPELCATSFFVLLCQMQEGSIHWHITLL